MTTTAAKTETGGVEIIEQPFDDGNDFFKPADPRGEMRRPDDEDLEDDVEDQDAGDGDGGSDDNLEPEGDPRLSALEAEVGKLRSELATTKAERESVQRSIALDNLMDQYDQAVAQGQFDQARQIRAKVVQAQAAAAQAAPRPGAPAGHWSNDVVAHIQAWTAKQPKLGVDAKWTAAVKQAGDTLDPAKFASPEAYLTAIEKAANEAVNPAPAAREAAPRPRTEGTRRMPSAGTQASAKGVTSINQLPARERSAAETAMRIGGLTEAEYLTSYNAVRASQARKGGRK